MTTTAVSPTSSYRCSALTTPSKSDQGRISVSTHDETFASSAASAGTVEVAAVSSTVGGVVTFGGVVGLGIASSPSRHTVPSIPSGVTAIGIHSSPGSMPRIAVRSAFVARVETATTVASPSRATLVSRISMSSPDRASRLARSSSTSAIVQSSEPFAVEATVPLSTPPPAGWVPTA